MTDKNMTVGEKIKSIREARGLTQKELAKKSGLAVSSIAKYEINNRIPKYEAVVKLASALNVNVEELTTVRSEEYEVDELSEAIGIILLDDNIKINGVVMTKAEKVEFAKFAKAIIDVMATNRNK